MQHELLIQQIVDHLKNVQGLKAIVLKGTHIDKSLSHSAW
jgi:hypothetical protein